MENQMSEIELGLKLAEDTSFLLALYYRFLIALLAVLCCGASVCFHLSRLNLHVNMRIIFANMALLVLIQCTTVGLAELRRIYIFSVWEDASELLMSPELCVAIIYPAGVSGFAVSQSLFVLAIERTVATVRSQSYERSSSLLGLSLAAAQWLAAGAVVVFYTQFVNFHVPTVYCLMLDREKIKTLGPLINSMMALEVVAICLLHILYVYNLRRRSRELALPLSERYQLHENLRSIRLLFPLAYVHFLLKLYGFAWHLWLIYHPSDDYRMDIIFANKVNPAHVYGILFPAVVAVQRRRWVTARRFDPAEEPHDVQQERHFRLLAHDWSAPPPRNTQRTASTKT